MTFDAKAFLAQPQQGGFEESMPVIPMGEWPATISKVDARVIELNKDRNDPSKGKEPRLIVAVRWAIDSQEVRDETGLDKPSVTQDLWLDALFDDDGNPVGLERGKAKNVSLGRFLAAFGMNADEFNWDELVGQAAMVTVDHRENPNDPENPYQNVKSVTELS